MRSAGGGDRIQGPGGRHDWLKMKSYIWYRMVRCVGVACPTHLPYLASLVKPRPLWPRDAAFKKWVWPWVGEGVGQWEDDEVLQEQRLFSQSSAGSEESGGGGPCTGVGRTLRPLMA